MMIVRFIDYPKGVLVLILGNGENFHNRHRTKKLQEDFNKYGFDSFEIIIYYSGSDINLLEQEKQKQISIGVNNLYNEKISGYYVDEEYRKKLASSSKNSHKTKEYREKNE